MHFSVLQSSLFFWSFEVIRVLLEDQHWEQLYTCAMINNGCSLTYYRKRGSASYIVREVLSVRERERERDTERERDGSDVTIFARLAMNSHFHLPKNRTIGDELTLSLAKNSHFSFLPSHFPSLPSRRGHHCGAEIPMSSHFPLPKIVSPYNTERERETEVTSPFSRDWRWIHTFTYQKIAQLAMSLHFPLPKNSHFSFLSLHGEVTIVALKFQWVHTFHCQKLFRPLCSPSFKWHEPHDEWSKTQDKWSNPAQSYFVLPIEKLNQINTKNYWK